ncbi:MAG: hypothetical protein GY708_22990 [Actinomycetia bacterium]|nr:hypothetical protein [Actinomycetes bacterium]MCP4961930.1 hypothetical protein [Actinomycetes bacterium]
MTVAQSTTWLRLASLLALAVGLVAAFASADATDGLWLWLFDLLEWPIDDNPGAFTDPSFALNAVLGGVMVGWATLMYFVTTRQFEKGNAELAAPMMVSILVWFVVDSTGSVVAGLPGNVILNTGFLAVFLPPLISLRRSHPTSPCSGHHRPGQNPHPTQ